MIGDDIRKSGQVILVYNLLQIELIKVRTMTSTILSR
jgi:hypothetical protein